MNNSELVRRLMLIEHCLRDWYFNRRAMDLFGGDQIEFEIYMQQIQELINEIQKGSKC